MSEAEKGWEEGRELRFLLPPPTIRDRRFAPRTASPLLDRPTNLRYLRQTRALR